MLETLMVARAVLHGRSPQPFGYRAEAKPSALATGMSAVRNVALKVSRWVGTSS